MKWLISILAMLLLVGCSRNEGRLLAEQSEISVITGRGGVIHSEQHRRGVPLPPERPQPREVPSQPTKSETVQELQKEPIGYRAKTDPVTGKITVYPVYKDEKK